MIVYSTYTDTYAEKLLNTLTRPILGVSNCDSHLDGMVPRWWWNPCHSFGRVSSWSGWGPPSSQRSHANPVMRCQFQSSTILQTTIMPHRCFGAKFVDTPPSSSLYIYIYYYILYILHIIYILHIRIYIYIYIYIYQALHSFTDWQLCHHPTWLKARDGLGCLESSRTSRRMARHTTGNVDEGAWLGVGIKKTAKKKPPGN